MNLPDEGELQLGPVTLPAGKWVRTRMGLGLPVAWVTWETVLDAGRVWQTLSNAHVDTGLVPFLLGHLRDHPDRPWDSGEFDDPADPALADAIDAGEVLESDWDGKTHEVGSDLAGENPGFAAYISAAITPFSHHFPGLAPAAQAALPGDELGQVVQALGPQRIGLVPAARPADVLSLTGWAPYPGPAEAVLEATAVVRSWEDRFGAQLLKLGFKDLSLLVTRPPRDPRHAERIAAEHFAFCDECTCSGMTTIPEISNHLLKSAIWTFWWD